MPLAVILALVACSPADPGDTAPTTDTAPATDIVPPTEPGTLPEHPSYAADIEPLLDLRCGGCHMDGSVSGGFAMSYATLVDASSKDVPSMDRIEPGEPDASYVWHKVNDSQLEVGGEGSQMPTQFSLKQAELALLERWIQDGATP